MIVRSWNVFHGNTVPPRRRARLDEMVRLVTADAPALVCLQELPAWALGRLEAWSGMAAVGDVARRPPLGTAVGRAITALHHGLLRSAVSGQANAVLVASSLRLLERGSLVLNPRAFRLPGSRERRICQAVRLALPDGRTMTLANLHATSHAGDAGAAAAEVLRAADFLEAVAEPGDVTVLAGDLNLAPGAPAYAELARRGFPEPGPGIDHVLVRGAAATPEECWPEERRRVDGLLLSDHAPVEVRIA